MTAVDVLVVDNADSFVHTLCDYLVQLGADVDVVSGHEIDADTAARLVGQHEAILISPGPGTPRAALGSVEVTRAATSSRTPVLGVCLGHQVIAETFGAVVDAAADLRHGMTSEIVHDGSPLYADLRQRFRATRYHSLAVRDDSVPEDLIVTARTPEGVIMGLRHRTLPIDGVQFHPESILSEGGHRLLANWLRSVVDTRP